MRSVASVTMCNAFFISTPPTFLDVQLTLLEYYGKVGVQKLSGFLCDGAAVHRLDTFVEKTAFLLHAKMHGCPGTQNMRI